MTRYEICGYELKINDFANVDKNSEIFTLAA